MIFSKDNESFLNAANEDQETALHKAVLSGNSEIVQLLLQNSCNVHCTNKKKQTPLHVAAYEGHLNCVKLLLAYSSDASLVNNSGETAKQLAQNAGHSQIAAFLEKLDEVQMLGVQNGKLSKDPNDIHSLIFINDTKALTNLLQAVSEPIALLPTRNSSIFQICIDILVSKMIFHSST